MQRWSHRQAVGLIHQCRWQACSAQLYQTPRNIQWHRKRSRPCGKASTPICKSCLRKGISLQKPTWSTILAKDYSNRWKSFRYTTLKIRRHRMNYQQWSKVIRIIQPHIQKYGPPPCIKTVPNSSILMLMPKCSNCLIVRGKHYPLTRNLPTVSCRWTSCSRQHLWATIESSLTHRRRDLAKSSSTHWSQALTKAPSCVTTTNKRSMVGLHISALPCRRELQMGRWKLSWPCSLKTASQTCTRSISGRKKVATSCLTKKTPLSILRIIRIQRITLPLRRLSHKTMHQLMSNSKILWARSI